jgi:hypothetical protein
MVSGNTGTILFFICNSSLWMAEDHGLNFNAVDSD